jgi:hypothetical protein
VHVRIKGDDLVLNAVSPDTFTVSMLMTLSDIMVAAPLILLKDTTHTVTTDSAPPLRVNCDSGCSSTIVSGWQHKLLTGRAEVEVDVWEPDVGRTLNIALRSDREEDGNYVTFSGNFGLRRPQPGQKYVIANSCDEAGAQTRRPDQLDAEYFVNGYNTNANQEVSDFHGQSGMLTVDELVGNRIKGHFEFLACHWLSGGGRQDVRLRGKFDAVWPSREQWPWL